MLHRASLAIRLGTLFRRSIRMITQCVPSGARAAVFAVCTRAACHDARVFTRAAQSTMRALGANPPASLAPLGQTRGPGIAPITPCGGSACCPGRKNLLKGMKPRKGSGKANVATTQSLCSATM